MINCPACGTPMTEIAIGDVKIDACQGGCGGLWFDRFELAKLEKAAQSAGAGLLAIDRSNVKTVAADGPRRCPRHADIVMIRRFSSIKRSVLVDECGKCGGVFLDAGELAGLEAEYASDAERQKATAAYYGEMFDHQLAQSRAADRAGVDSARSVVQMFRFICPSYYIPGKQRWGAF